MDALCHKSLSLETMMNDDLCVLYVCISPVYLNPFRSAYVFEAL
jgi:hypothetical protein